MKSTTLAVFASSLGLAQSFMTQGFTVQEDDSIYPDWEAAYKDGARFVTIRATAGTLDLDERFQQYWADSRHNGLIRGAVHQARPNEGSGTEQAEFFLHHGGRWVADNMTLPGIPGAGQAGNGQGGGVLGPEHDADPALPAGLLGDVLQGDEAGAGPPHQLGLAPPDDHDLEILYGVSWTLWENGEFYKYGGMSQMFNGDYAFLRSYTLRG